MKFTSLADSGILLALDPRSPVVFPFFGVAAFVSADWLLLVVLWDVLGYLPEARRVSYYVCFDSQG